MEIIPSKHSIDQAKGFTDKEVWDWENAPKYIARNPAYVHAKDKYDRTVLYNALHAPASSQPSSDFVEFLIKSKSDVNAQDRYLDTPLHAALHGDHYLNALTLLNNKAKILQNCNKQSPLHMLFCIPTINDHENERLEVIKAVLKQDPTCINWQDEKGNTALHLAVGDHHTPSTEVELLLQLGSNTTLRDKEGNTALDVATKYNPSMAYLFKMEIKPSVSFTDQEIGDWKNTATYIARNPAYVHAKDEYGRTALYNALHAPASEQASNDFVELLIKSKSDVDSQDTTYLDTPLYATLYVYGLYEDHHYLNALTLLKNNAKILQNKYKLSPLHKVFCVPILNDKENERLEVIKAILKQDPACINLQNEYGETALHFAVGNHHSPKEIELLLQLGSNITLRDNEGNTALDIAIEYNPSMVPLFKTDQLLKNQ